MTTSNLSLLVGSKSVSFVLYRPSTPTTVADVWVNGGSVSGTGAYDYRHRALMNAGIAVLVCTVDPMILVQDSQIKSLPAHVAGARWLLTQGYTKFSFSGHSGGAGMAVESSRLLLPTTMCVVSGGGLPSVDADALVITGNGDYNPTASKELRDRCKTYLWAYHSKFNHTYSCTVLGNKTTNEFYQSNMDTLAIQVAWLRFRLCDVELPLMEPVSGRWLEILRK